MSMTNITHHIWMKSIDRNGYKYIVQMYSDDYDGVMRQMKRYEAISKDEKGTSYIVLDNKASVKLEIENCLKSGRYGIDTAMKELKKCCSFYGIDSSDIKLNYK